MKTSTPDATPDPVGSLEEGTKSLSDSLSCLKEIVPAIKASLAGTGEPTREQRMLLTSLQKAAAICSVQAQLVHEQAQSVQPTLTEAENIIASPPTVVSCNTELEQTYLKVIQKSNERREQEGKRPLTEHTLRTQIYINKKHWRQGRRHSKHWLQPPNAERTE